MSEYKNAIEAIEGRLPPSYQHYVDSIKAKITSLEEQRVTYYDIGFDEDASSVRDYAVCSSCGINHDRDESAMCENGQVVTHLEYVELLRQRVAAAKAEIAQLKTQVAADVLGFDGMRQRAEAAEAEAVRLNKRLAAVNKRLAEGWDEVVAKDKARAIKAEIRAKAAEAKAARLRDGLRPIVREYDLWSEDANDGEFRLWDLDRLVAAIVAARALLAEDGAPAPQRSTTADVIEAMDRDPGFDGGAA